MKMEEKKEREEENKKREEVPASLFTFDLAEFEGACLYFRRSIVNLPASSRKERVLFYLDQLIDEKPYASLSDIESVLVTLASLISHEVITRDMREHFLYLKERFDSLKELSLLMAEADPV
jgi:hypothetical protein